MVYTFIALKQYKLKHGKYPETLKLLLDNNLRANYPIDYYTDSQPLSYRVHHNQAILWSVGEDGKTDKDYKNPIDDSVFILK